jgi:GNAT superfamily N-acetyltransferase
MRLSLPARRVSLPGESEIKISRLREDEIPEVIRVKAEVYGTAPSEEPGYYRWKFFLNPHRGEAVPFWLLRDHGRLLGGIGALPVRMMIFGREQRGEFACEMFIEKAQQRSGLGTVLMDAYIADSPLPLMMNTSPSLRRFLVKRGFFDLTDQIHFSLRPQRPGALMSAGRGGKWVRRAGWLVGPVAGAIIEARAAALRRRPDPGVAVEEVEAFGEWAEEVWRSAAADYPVVVIRDLAYLRWKYEQHPRWSYRILRAVRGGRAVGYLTFRVHSKESNPMVIVQEIFAPREESGARLALLEHVRFAARKVGAIALKALASDPALTADLRRAGYIQHRTSPGMLYPRQPGFDRPDLQDIHTWYLTGGDSDIDY